VGFERNRKKQVNGIWKESLRKIFGPTKDGDGTWRIKTSGELIRLKIIINHIKAQRLIWFGRENGKKKYISGNLCQYDHKGDQRTDGKTT